MSLRHPVNALQNMSDRKPPPSGRTDTAPSTLADACRRIVVNNLERYPPEAFAILDEGEWETVIRLRHEETRPLKGTGGLDGSGRMKPAVGYSFMVQVEDACPHLAESTVIDTLVWRDCVEHRFKAGGVARPPELMYPWPYLVEHVRLHGRSVASRLKDKKGHFDAEFREAVESLQACPMNVPLLTSSKVGVTVKKYLKNYSKVYPDGSSGGDWAVGALDATLRRWMAIAEQSGVKLDRNVSTDGPRRKVQVQPGSEKALQIAQRCSTWRQLFASLHSYEDEQKSNQGARMRERRKRLYQNRPQIVKVRPSRTKNNNILGRRNQSRFGGSAVPSTNGTSKIQQLRMETQVTSSRRQPPTATPPSNSVSVSKGGAFSTAVAFASVSKKGAKRRGTPTVVSMGNGKRMRIPDNKKASQHTSALKKRLGMLKKPPR